MGELYVKGIVVYLNLFWCVVLNLLLFLILILILNLLFFELGIKMYMIK